MKKALLFLSFMLSAGTLFAGNFWGDFKVPVDRRGVKALNVEDTGVFVASVMNSSVPHYLTNYLFVANGSATVTGSSIAVFGVLTSTAGDNFFKAPYVELRSTNTANTTSELLFPPVVVTSASRNTFVQFTPPIIANDGLSVNIVFDTPTVTSVSIFYRYLSTNVVEDFIIPKDNNNVPAIGGADFYGVAAASEAHPGGTHNDGVNDGEGMDGLDYTSSERVVLARSSPTESYNTPGLFYGMVVGTASVGAVRSFAVFRDSVSTGGINEADRLIVPLFYNTFNLEDALWTIGNFPKFSTAHLKVIRFPWPIIFRRGLTQQRSVATDTARIFVRPLITDR